MSFARNNTTSSWTGERSVIMHTNKQQFAKAKSLSLGTGLGGLGISCLRMGIFP